MIKSKILMSVLVGSAVMLSACGSMYGKQAYRAADGRDLLIAGSIDLGEATFHINGQQVIKGPWMASSLEGKYNGMKVVSMCRKINHLVTVDFICDVYIDGRLAATIDMK